MHVSEVIRMIRPAIDQPSGTWADFGAGTGLFTMALAELLDSSATIYSIDRDGRILEALAKSLQLLGDRGPTIVPVEGDFQDLEGINALDDVQLDGAVFANALHFSPDAGGVLAQLRSRLCKGGRIVVIEYEGRPPSRWVPYPISIAALQRFARQAQLRFVGVLSHRPSRYGGKMYCAVLENRWP